MVKVNYFFIKLQHKCLCNKLLQMFFFCSWVEWTLLHFAMCNVGFLQWFVLVWIDTFHKFDYASKGEGEMSLGIEKNLIWNSPIRKESLFLTPWWEMLRKTLIWKYRLKLICIEIIINSLSISHTLFVALFNCRVVWTRMYF